MELSAGQGQRRIEWRLVAGRFLGRLATLAGSVLFQEVEGACAWDELVDEWHREAGTSMAFSNEPAGEPIGRPAA